MPLLYYWRGDNYRRDLDHGVGFHLNQSSPALHRVALGESLWAFTRRADGVYALAAELVVRHRTRNPAGFRYGGYRVWGDLVHSRYFLAPGQPDLSALVRGLSVRVGAGSIGRSFQGRAAVRQITWEDDAALRRYAERLPLEPRARLIPEERLEALLAGGDPQRVEALLVGEPSGLAEARRRYLTSEAVTRSRRWVEALRDLYEGRCQLCGWCPRGRYGADLCEAHHVHWISRGGTDGLSNLVLLCPNHHRVVHRLDAPFDWEGPGGFYLRDRREPLQLCRHELAPVGG